MTDLPEMTIATDTVDVVLVDRPRRWNIDFIKKFMLTFGLVSSIFDFLTFGVLLFLLHASERQFQTGWFMESVVSATMIVLVIRTRKPFFRSRPGKLLVLATLLVIGAVIALPYTPIAPVFKFEPLPPVFLLTLAVIVGLYVAMAEIAKRIFYRVVKF
jgi:Mg2+-importing ATPase